MKTGIKGEKAFKCKNFHPNYTNNLSINTGLSDVFPQLKSPTQAYQL